MLITRNRERLCFGTSTGMGAKVQLSGRDFTAIEQSNDPLPLISNESGTG